MASLSARPQFGEDGLEHWRLRIHKAVQIKAVAQCHLNFPFSDRLPGHGCSPHLVRTKGFSWTPLLATGKWGRTPKRGAGSPARTADGIRANLEVLRQHLPEARILLLGLLPREAVPNAPLRIEVAQVNRLIRDCADDQHVFYAEIGDVLLTSAELLSAEISPDQLHFAARGYALLAGRLEPELDRLLRDEH